MRQLVMVIIKVEKLFIFHQVKTLFIPCSVELLLGCVIADFVTGPEEFADV